MGSDAVFVGSSTGCNGEYLPLSREKSRSVDTQGLIAIAVFVVGMIASLGVPALYRLERGTVDRPEFLVDPVSGRQIAYSYDDTKKLYYMYEKDVAARKATVLTFSYRQDNKPITNDDKLLSVKTIHEDGTVVHTNIAGL